MLTVKNLINLNKNFSRSLARLIIRSPKYRNYSSASSVSSNIDLNEPQNFAIEQKLQNLIQNEIRNQSVVPIFKQALLYNHKTALKDQYGEYSYGQIYMAAKKLSVQISNLCGEYNYIFNLELFFFLL